MTINPTLDRVLVEPDEPETKSPGGIILPTDAQPKPTTGKVLAVGPGKRDDNDMLIEMSVKKGDSVLYGKYGGMDVPFGGKTLKLLNESEIYAILK